MASCQTRAGNPWECEGHPQQECWQDSSWSLHLVRTWIGVPLGSQFTPCLLQDSPCSPILGFCNSPQSLPASHCCPTSPSWQGTCSPSTTHPVSSTPFALPPECTPSFYPATRMHPSIDFNLCPPKSCSSLPPIALSLPTICPCIHL